MHHHHHPPQYAHGAGAQAAGHAFRQGRNCNGDQFSLHSAISNNTLPKHIPIPSIPREGDIFFELIMFAFTAICCSLQFLIIYRSVFWLPYSFNSLAVNIHLIDSNLVIFIGTILVRRLVYITISNVGQAYFSSMLWPVVHKFIRGTMLCWVSVVIITCLFNIMRTHPIVKLFYLCYPISLYFILFGLTLGPFFDLMGCTSAVEDQQSKILLSFDGCPLHNCSTSPEAIREEVDVLKSDVNKRIKQVLFNSVFSAYYAGFIPCCFAQTMMYYDTYWATLHIAWLWLGSFVLYITHCFPLRYCDVMHRSAVHLGRWNRLLLRTPNNMLWADNTLWPKDSVVEYCDTVYQASNSTNAAEPGNQAHSRFYDLFQNPTSIYTVALTLQLTMILVQLFQLVTAKEWYHAVCTVLVLFFNYYTLYKVVRDLLICHRVYKAERIVKERGNS